MQLRALVSTLALALLVSAAQAQTPAIPAGGVKAFSLTEIGDFVYDANTSGANTPAQDAVDYLYSLGVRHIVLTPEANMLNGTDNIIVPKTAGPAMSAERMRYVRLIQYIKSKGMTVGIRPIFLVQNTQGGRFWHGNIKPTNPQAWFQSFRQYMTNYANIAKLAKADEFTVGAELYSMTVGIEDQWPEQPFGFPREYAEVVASIRAIVGPGVRLMYDANYTDMTANGDGTGAGGGEIERWRYRLVDLKPGSGHAGVDTPQSAAAWDQVNKLWSSFDVFGIDMYRSLLPRGERAPTDYKALVARLGAQANQFAQDLDSKLFEIQMATGVEKKIIIKELGYKSCTNCFIDPGVYDDARLQVNVSHQSAAYEAVLGAFFKPGWSWYGGISFWDISVNPARSGERDPGFSPRGKAQTEAVIRKFWQ